MKKYLVVLIPIFLLSCSKNNNRDIEISGWNILSDNIENGFRVIDAAKKYNINHLELSHELIHDLQHVRDVEKLEKTKLLLDSAHKAGIKNVFVWDRAFYKMAYYPDTFKIDVDGKKCLNLDNPDFWVWFRQDYKDMFSKLPDVDGIVLTFIETGSKIENQYSASLNQYEKMAMVVDTIASIVINELGKKMHIRSFIHTKSDKDVILGCLKYINNPNLVLMVKEVPHDFFNLHPLQKYVEEIDMPMVIEFDAAHEYNGQGIVANTFTNLILNRWKYYLKQEKVIGYVARTDRYNTTAIIDRPSEILLYALSRAVADTTVTEDVVCDEFISNKYGKEAITFVKPAFKSAIDINLSSFYTLGINASNHSRLDMDWISTFTRYIAGRWYEPPHIHINNDVNKEFHYFKDIIEHLSPARFKSSNGRLAYEEPYIFENKWLTETEKINEEYLSYIVTEKDFSVAKAEEALDNIVKAKTFVKDSIAYIDLYETFYRTLLIAQQRRAAHKMYYGYRLYVTDTAAYKMTVLPLINEGIQELESITKEMETHSQDIPSGQWGWFNGKSNKKSEIEIAKGYLFDIQSKGWAPYSNIAIK